jgi:CubicO group peptidase (beta-lactamase class C family)
MGPAFAAFVFAGLLVSVLGTAAVSAQTVADVEALVSKAVETKGAPAIGVAVVRDGKVVLAKGYGVADAEGSVAANENTGFQIASVTKQFTAAAIMMLVEDGKLSLSDPLNKFVPDVPAKWGGVTVRQLLNQVSGIPNYTAVGKLVNTKTYTKAEILNLVRDVPPEFAPGAEWQYSNTNYFLLGMIIEKVSGKSYENFMRDRIFKPLGMTSTVINTSGLKIANAAVGHRNEAGAWKRGSADDPSQPWAAGAIVSTPVDLAKWAAAQGDAKLLKKASWDEIWAPAKLTDGRPSNYGFGWGVDKLGEVTMLSHGGGIAGFNSHISRFPNDNLSVVVVANTNTRLAEQLALDIAGLYISKVASFLAAQRAAKSASTIADADPDTTKFLRSAFEKMVTGEISADLFNAEMQKLLFPDRIKQLQGPLGSQGAIKSFELLKAADKDGVKTRTYRITFESGVKVTGNFALDAQGKISGAGFRPEQ